MTIECIAHVVSLALVAGTGLFALDQLFRLEEPRTTVTRMYLAASLLFTLSAVWMVLHLFVGPCSTAPGADGLQASYEVLGAARDVGICWFHLVVRCEAKKLRARNTNWGEDYGHAVSRSRGAGRLAGWR